MDSVQPTKPVLLAYIPVVHEGYRHFVAKYTTGADSGRTTENSSQVNTAYILATEVAHELRSLQKDVRALSAESVCITLQALFPNLQINIATHTVLAELAASQTKIIAPYEDITRHVVTTYLPENEAHFDSIFLRWDRKNSVIQYPPSPTDRTTWPTFTSEFMNIASEEAAKSADWWRQVGAVIVRDGQILATAYNRHLPTEQQTYINGDPRAAFSSGIEIELATSIHAEASAIAHAARTGLALEGAEIYTTTFPCPVCAKLIAESGIAKLYYADGYSMLDGEDILKNRNVEIIKLEALTPAASQS